MSFLSSWWSPQQNEDKKDVQSEQKAEESSPDATAKSSDWVTDLESSAFAVMKKVTGYASSLGESAQVTIKKVSESSLIGDFQKEQEKFEREQRRQKDSAIPPWVGYNEEEKMKADILQLSADSRNVLREPPPGVQFQFDFARSFPVAMAILKEDPKLQKLRFELVPKKISEQSFWCNYFYRVFLIKQSSQLATLSAADAKVTLQERPVEEEKSIEGTDNERKPAEAPHPESFTAEPYSSTQGHPEEFASDAFHQGDENINRESLKSELGQLGVASTPQDPATWEDELQAELKDLDLTNLEGGELPENKEAWEAELEQMLDMHS